MIKRLLISAGFSVALMFTAIPAHAYKYELIIIGSNLIKQGKQALRDGRLEEAIRIYTVALDGRLSASDVQIAHNDLCVAYYLNRDFDVALGQCDQAIRLTSNEWVSYNNRANIYLAMGEVDRAMRDYEKALELSPQSEVLRANIDLAARFRDAGPVEAEISSSAPEGPNLPNLPNFPVDNDRISQDVIGR
jgi:Flp pilus assembly protein TadD